jgi:hypothetical protein
MITKSKLLMATALAWLTSVTIFAQQEPRKNDLPGSKDYPLISRYDGAVIQNYEETDFDRYTIALGLPVEKEFRGHGKFLSKYKDLEGRIIRIQYLISRDEELPISIRKCQLPYSFYQF